MRQPPNIFQKTAFIFLAIVGICFGFSPGVSSARTKSLPSSQSTSVYQYHRYGEWLYSPQWNPPSLLWRNERMPQAPILFISFLPDRIYLYATVFRDTIGKDPGIIFYIKDKQDKLALTLSLVDRNTSIAHYSATIFGENRAHFISTLTSSRKVRLIVPASYSQSLSLKKIPDAIQVILHANPELQKTFQARP